MSLIRKLAVVIVALGSVSVAKADFIVSHLDTPSIYDNSEFPDSWGQTFVTSGQTVVGVDIYIGDPTRPDVNKVNELEGPAELRLYEISDLNNPILLGSSSVALAGDILFGLQSLDFNSPILTTSGVLYFFAVFAEDFFGLGLQDQFVSTYADGSEAVYRNGSVIPHFSRSGRLTSPNPSQSTSSQVPNPSAEVRSRLRFLVAKLLT